MGHSAPGLAQPVLDSFIGVQQTLPCGLHILLELVQLRIELCRPNQRHNLAGVYGCNVVVLASSASSGKAGMAAAVQNSP